MTANDVCRALYNARYHYHSEKDLQHGVAQVLSSLELSFKPEYLLGPRDRIDFFLSDDSGIGIECKVGGTLNALVRQLGRYASTGKVKELIVLTTRSTHQQGIPFQIHGVPVFVVVISPF
jgi:hypothetical protein